MKDGLSRPSFLVPINIKDIISKKVMKILDKDFTPKYGLRAMFAFEEIAGKAFEVNTLIDTYVFCYACLISNKDNPSLDFCERELYLAFRGHRGVQRVHGRRDEGQGGHAA